ncbi:hypothetical protein EST38_g14173, partial [Candolleomyces aberdarensis]
MSSSNKDCSAQAHMFHYTGGDVNMLSDKETQISQEKQNSMLGLPLALKSARPAALANKPIVPDSFVPPESYEPTMFSPGHS